MVRRCGGGSEPDVFLHEQFAGPRVSVAPDDAVATLRLHAEEVTVEGRRVPGDTVRVATLVQVREAQVELGLMHERVEIERVPVDRIVEAVPPVRQEGDVTVLPVVEEVLVVERRLVLKEEVRVRRVQVPETHRETVSLREQVVEASRVAGPRSTSPARENPMSGYLQSNEQTIVAVYDTPAHAELAVQDLLQAHVPASSIERHTEAGSYLGETSAEPVRKPGGFLASLFGTEQHADSTTYSESMSRGGTVVTVHGIPHEDFERVAALLEAHHPIEFDDGHAGTGMGTPAMTDRAMTDRAMTDSAYRSADTAVPSADNDRGTLQLSEESLVVGKRLVNRGGTRIRRYVVETPVEEQVSLHDERVVVDRHPVADGRAVDADAFADNDRVIEMSETSEEAVVGKTVRVVEEISLRREGMDRTETVHETVRREEVEVTKLPKE